ncbi:hypothetical protein HGA64_02785 [Candidatus Falkowbacteria bacterium]|nr:hypothetical protein [Candidatus Falkowbacteria bacterium]
MINEIKEVDGVSLVGVDYPSIGEKQDLISIINKLDPAKPAILMYHEPKLTKMVEDTGKIDFMLSGHTHNGQLWPFNYIVKAIYKQFAAGMYRDGDFTSYTSVGTGTWGPPLRIGNTPEITVFTLKNKQ